MSLSNAPLSEQWRRAADVHADLEAAATLLEECRSAVLAELMIKQGDIPVSRAEMHSKASEEYRLYLDKMVRARKAANKAAVEKEYMRMKFWEGYSQAANDRFESRL